MTYSEKMFATAFAIVCAVFSFFLTLAIKTGNGLLIFLAVYSGVYMLDMIINPLARG